MLPFSGARRSRGRSALAGLRGYGDCSKPEELSEVPGFASIAAAEIAMGLSSWRRAPAKPY
jgi:hypothetical protein